MNRDNSMVNHHAQKQCEETAKCISTRLKNKGNNGKTISMTKITIILSVILVSSLFIFFPSTRGSTDEPMVGVFYYPWYNEAENGTGHWSGRPEWTVVDIPCFGWYSILDNVTIKKQLDLMHNAGIDFIILSWWGPNTPYGEDTSCQYIFAATQKYYPTTMKAFLMVEEILQNNSALGNYTTLCDYVNRTYVGPFGDQYFNLDGRPVLAWWASANMTDNGKYHYVQNASEEYNFTCRIIGYPGYHPYRNWSAWTPSSSTPDDTTINCSQQDGFVFIEPRFDNRYKKMWDSNSYGNTTFDQNLTQGGYDDQWNQVLNRQRSDHDVRIVCIYSWNSYDERSAIEPCINYNIDPEYLYSVPHSDPEYLLNRTQYYIAQLHSLTVPEFQPFSLVPLGIATAGIVATAVAVYRRKKLHNTRKSQSSAS